jgi:ribosome-binding factor A
MTKKQGPSQRQLRVGEEIRHILAETLFLRHSGDPLIDSSSITVTEVRVSPDLQNATVFVLPLGGQHVPEILAALKDNSKYFRKEVAHKLKTRVTPRLFFQADFSFDEASHIESLLKAVKTKNTPSQEG